MSSRRVRVGVESLEGRQLQAAFGLPFVPDVSGHSSQMDLIRLQSDLQKWTILSSTQTTTMQNLTGKLKATVGGVQ